MTPFSAGRVLLRELLRVLPVLNAATFALATVGPLGIAVTLGFTVLQATSITNRSSLNSGREPAAARYTRRAILRTSGTLHHVVYRASRGRIGGRLRGGRVVLLTTTGRRTGKPRTWPLCSFGGEETLIVVASAAGQPRHPAWYLNLRANPRVSIQVGGRARPMVARTAEGAERARLWQQAVETYPVLVDYQRNADRLFPVVILRSIRVHSATKGHHSERLRSICEFGLNLYSR